MKQYAVFLQDDWRLTDRLTLNLGFRYDLVTGMAIDQTKNPNFVILDKAGKAGALAGIAGFEDFGKSPAEDKNNYQPRVGFVYDLNGNGLNVIRGGWGRYYDFGYTNANILFAAVNATGIGAGTIFQVTNSNGIRNPDGSFFKVSRPDQQHSGPQRGRRRAAAQLAHRVAADQAAVLRPDVVRVFAPGRFRDGVRR